MIFSETTHERYSPVEYSAFEGSTEGYKPVRVRFNLFQSHKFGVIIKLVAEYGADMSGFTPLD